jgi:hypothetical protein
VAVVAPESLILEMPVEDNTNLEKALRLITCCSSAGHFWVPTVWTTASSSVSRATTQHTKEGIMEMGQLLGPNPTFPISGESAATTLVCVGPTN